jgi:hypothetical protein
LLVPRFQRLKEWAYAGAFFNYTGAAASHIAVGDRAAKWIMPLVFAAFTVASCALRPPQRRLAPASSDGETRTAAWVIPVVVFLALFVLAFATLPKGPPPP